MIHILACVVTLSNCTDYMCLYCFMSISHSINGIPACANKKLLTDIARQEWNFTGYIVSDQGAIGEMVSPATTLLFYAVRCTTLFYNYA